MPSWGELLKELNTVSTQLAPGTSAFDFLRRKYLVALQQHTKRNTILYATRWTATPLPFPIPPQMIMITDEDMEGFMEVFNGLSGDSLDMILHSPGGLAESTDSLVTYIRSKFSDVRIFIPHAAMSAATMLACSADKMVMGAQSSIGPIDPQFTVVGEGGIQQSTPAQAILEQFKLAKKECRDPNNLPAWVPTLKGYGPALLVQCEEALNLSKELVKTWLAKYMLHGRPHAARKAAMIAKRLADHKTFKTHARHLGRDWGRSLGLVIDDLEKDPKVEDLVLSVFHATSLTFTATATTKIIENHLGRAWIRAMQIGVAPIASTQRQPSAPAPQPPGASPPSTPQPATPSISGL